MNHDQYPRKPAQPFQPVQAPMRDQFVGGPQAAADLAREWSEPRPEYVPSGAFAAERRQIDIDAEAEARRRAKALMARQPSPESMRAQILARMLRER